MGTRLVGPLNPQHKAYSWSIPVALAIEGRQRDVLLMFC